MDAARQRVVFLALDAVDADTMRDLADRGLAPTISGLLRRAAVVETRAPDGFFVSAHWPTFSTALDPARHHYYCWKQLVPGSYEDAITSPHMVDGTPFWERVSDHGRQVAVFDVPHSLAPTAFNGSFVAEWGCHDRHVGPHSFPPGLLDEMTERFGPHPVGQMDPPLRGFDQFAPCDYRHREGQWRNEGELKRLWAELVDGLERKRAAAKALQVEGDWDLFLAVYGEGHCTGHQYWHLHDPAHAWYDPELVEAFGHEPVAEMYGELDAAVGAHLALVDEETTVYVHLSHGMGPHHDGSHLLDDVLRRLAASTPPALDRARAHAVGAVLGSPKASAAASRFLRRPRTGAVPDLGPDPDPDGHDRAGRPYFAVPNNTVSGAIRLNLIGREPHGQLAPGRDADRAIELLTMALEELVNLDTGERAVDAVVRVERRYDREPGDAFPDLFVEWNRSAPIERVWSPRIGTVERRYSHWRSGDHHAAGLLLALGPDITPGVRDQPLDTVDLAATVAAATGVVLHDVDGRARTDLLPAGARHLGTERRAVRQTESPRTSVWQRVRTAVAPDPRDTELLRRLATLEARSARDESAVGALRWEFEGLRGHVGHIDNQIHALTERADAQVGHTTSLDDRLARAELRAGIRAVTAWLENAIDPPTTTVSVVMPTRNRAGLLGRAVASVEAQLHQCWQLVVVDDGSRDGTAEILDALTDPRVTTVRIDGRGASAARNAGLEACDGDVVTYLDDDNVLDPLWLRAVAWAFETHPDEDVLYGVRVIDDLARVERWGTGSLPVLHFEPYDRRSLHHGNIVDMGVIAHRRVHPEARFDEELKTHADWELFARLTQDRPPLPLPVIACYYSSDAPDRLSDDYGDLEVARRKVLASGT